MRAGRLGEAGYLNVQQGESEIEKSLLHKVERYSKQCDLKVGNNNNNNKERKKEDLKGMIQDTKTGNDPWSS